MRTRCLEDTVQKLSNRSEVHGEVARLSGEVSKLRRSGARLQSDLIFCQDRVEALLQELTETRGHLLRLECADAEQSVYGIRTGVEGRGAEVCTRSSQGGQLRASVHLQTCVHVEVGCLHGCGFDSVRHASLHARLRLRGESAPRAAMR